MEILSLSAINLISMYIDIRIYVYIYIYKKLPVWLSV